MEEIEILRKFTLQLKMDLVSLFKKKRPSENMSNCSIVELLAGKSVTAIASLAGLSEREVAALAVYSPGLVHRYALGYLDTANFLAKSQVITLLFTLKRTTKT